MSNLRLRKIYKNRETHKTNIKNNKPIESKDKNLEKSFKLTCIVSQIDIAHGLMI